ncbi:MAG: serine/threonine protein kinase, partial [Ruminococcus sp.]|nr:serine/threonine protein kinase [Ruminococcus sp.]
MRKNILEANRKLNMRYRLIRSIGQGGFGITYVAEDEVMKQHVVIKEYFPVMLAGRSEQGELILPDTADEKEKYQEGMKRFLNEAKILASLFDVPGVVKVLDYFQENQTAYIVMEYVKGTSLRDYLESMGEELSFEKTCEMLKPVMIALEKVHQKGLLHRDISPDNLMVEEDGKIKMLDFGSAREYFLEQDREKTLTI